VREITSFWILPSLVAGIVLFGWARGVKVFASLVEGAKEGFQVAIRILPYLVAVVTAVGMFRASGALDALTAAIEPVSGAVGLPAEAIPLVALRPLSGAGSFAVLGEILARRGPDSYVGYVASALQGSTETTFYVLAVYFGAVGVRRTRHAVAACLIGDAVGMAAAVVAARILFG
jgi:spore maturation protein SpmB